MHVSSREVQQVSEVRKDVVRDKWVVIATNRAVKPNNLPVPAFGGSTSKMHGFCPFCEGNEGVTPPELGAVRHPGSEANGPGWTIRAVPNKFSGFSLTEPLAKEVSELYTFVSGFGAHEVVIETPEHDLDLHEQPVTKISGIFNMLKERHMSLSQDQRLKYIQIYKNRGLFAGASLSHSHTQIVALPYVPAEFNGATRYASETGRCFFCDMISQELESRERLVLESDNFVIVCPYASRFTYETWIIPKKHHDSFGGISSAEIDEVSELIKKSLQGLVDVLNDPSYNMVINTAPINVEPIAGYHWFIEIFPRLIVQAAVEIATGYYMNPISPEWAAEVLRTQFSK